MALKGQVEIQLTDVNTGKVKSIKGHNMVTNALRDIFSMAPLASPRSVSTGSYSSAIYNILGWWFPLTTFALGGLILFDDDLDDTDADDYRVPDNVHIVGYGAHQIVDASSPFRGTYNSIESGQTETGYKHVWDFGTSQGNGTIKSLSLTNAKFGIDPVLGGDSSGLFSGNHSMDYMLKQFTVVVGGNPSASDFIIKYDETTKEFYWGHYTNANWTNTGSLNIYKRYIDFEQVTLNTTPDTMGDTELVTTISLTYPGSYYQNSFNTAFTFEPDLNRFTIVSYYRDSSGYMWWTTINTNDWSNDGIHTATGSTLGVNITTLYGRAFIRDGYLYCTDKTKMYKVNMADNTDVTILYTGTELSITDWYSSNCLLCGDNLDSSSQPQYFLYYIDNGSAVYSANPGTYPRLSGRYPNNNILNPGWLDTHQKNLIRAVWYDSNGWIGITNKYLATKFNLPSAVTKTAAQTMKVIYTLTDAGSGT